MFDRILVPTDGSKLSALALERALDLARALGSRVVVLHVVPEVVPVLASEVAMHVDLDAAQRDLIRDGDRTLDAAQTLAAARGVPFDRQIRLPQGHHVGDVIAGVAREVAADLIVMGTHGRSGIGRLVLGSVAERVAHQAEAPVMLVRAPKAP